MIANKSLFTKGMGMLIGFFIVLFAMFMPLIDGHNFLNSMDSLYNSISKGSAYYIPKMKEDITEVKGKNVSMKLTMASEKAAKETALLISHSGAAASAEGEKISVSGDLEAILANCLEDSDYMFHNEGEKVAAKYGYNEKQVLYNWYLAAIQMDKELKHQKLFKEAKIVAAVQAKAVECAFNYYKIVPENIKDKVGIVFISLLFYVIYTLWFGFSIMFLFEGWGMHLEHH
ncbi:MAG: hypothetical protein V2I97_08505 [Desulfococcaceae bacterium]|jgi:hypothetical protein|nr:hypothetical protein [Desulfococcaceae bacterium]